MRKLFALLVGVFAFCSFAESAVVQEVTSPTLFDTNVFLFDEPDTPLHLRLGATTNSAAAIAEMVMDSISQSNDFSSLTLSGDTIEGWDEIGGGGQYLPATNYDGDYYVTNNVTIGGDFTAPGIIAEALGDQLSILYGWGCEFSFEESAFNMGDKPWVFTNGTINFVSPTRPMSWNGEGFATTNEFGYQIKSENYHSVPYIWNGLGSYSPGPYSFIKLQSYFTNGTGHAGIQITADGEHGFGGPYIILSAKSDITQTSPTNVVKSTTPDGGLVLTNSANGNFTVTWNGVTKTGWDEIVDTNAFVSKSGDTMTGTLVITNSDKSVDISPNQLVVRAYNTLGAEGATETVFMNPGGMARQEKYNYWTYAFPSNSGTLALLSDIGGGLTAARVLATNATVLPDDYLLWLDTRAFTSSSSVTLTLPDMDGDSQTIVVRRLGNDGTATIERGTNTWSLTYDGDGVTVDWLKAATNWFWRSF